MKHTRLCAFALLLVTLTTLSQTARANVGEAFGFGSRTASLGGAGVAWGFEGFSAYSNPAGLAQAGNKRLLLSWSIMDHEYRFTPISNVIVENTATSDKETISDVDLDYRSTFGSAYGFVYQLFPEFHRFSLGLTVFMPVNQVAYMDSGETFVPEYMLYRSRTQRPQFELGVGIETTPGLYFGLGMHMAFSLTSNASVFISTSTPSSMRFASSLKPKLTPYLGVLFVPDNAVNPAYTLGAVFRFAATSANNLTLRTSAQLLGSLAAPDFNLSAYSALFYDPLKLELGATFKTVEDGRLYLQADFQAWHQFEPPAITIEEPTLTSTGVPVKGSQNPGFDYRNIIIPRLGHEYAVNGTTTVRAGYAYRPGIIRTPSTGQGNYLDPSKHMLNAGVGFKYNTFLSFNTPCTLDFNASYQALVAQQITKTPGVIGAPGYEAGGKIFGGGASLNLAF
jgi:hypothetical protein